MHNLLDMVLEMCPLGVFWLWCATAQHRGFVTLPSQILYSQNLSFLKELLAMQFSHFRFSTSMPFDTSDKNSRACLAFKSQTLKTQSMMQSFFSFFFFSPQVSCISFSWEITALQIKFTLAINMPSWCGRGSWGTQLQSWLSSLCKLSSVPLPLPASAAEHAALSAHVQPSITEKAK